MIYRIEILRTAHKQLAKIETAFRQRLIEAIRRLSDNPRPPDCRKLTGRPAWRIRVGDYRVIYEIQDDRLVVLVVALAHRREAYRK